jgi:hypothetical protein
VVSIAIYCEATMGFKMDTTLRQHDRNQLGYTDET